MAPTKGWGDGVETDSYVTEGTDPNRLRYTMGIGSIPGAPTTSHDSGRNGGLMYASVRKYSVDDERVNELMHQLDQKCAARLEQMPGFIAYQAIDAGVDRAGEDTVFTVTICGDREAADRSAEIAAQFIRDELGEMKVERLEAATGAVRVNRAMSEVLDAAHA
jgi:hypothetical protein